MLLSGSTGCGKSTFICRLLTDLDASVDTKIEQVVWFYAESNSRPSFPPQLEQKLNLKFQKGVPEKFVNETGGGVLIILDDLMDETGDDERVSQLFTRASHHQQISIILTTQNLFHQGKFFRTISLNSKYIVIFKNPRDSLQALALSKQVYPENSRELNKVYKLATVRPFAFLLLDLSQNIHPQLRFRAGNIFDNDICICYCNLKTLTDGNNIGGSSADADDDDTKTNEIESAFGSPTYSICPQIGQ